MKEDRTTMVLGAGGASAAVASALCCIGPLLAVIAGVSGAGLSGMSKKEWTAVVLVILVGIILQIPGGMGSQGEPIGDRQASATVDPANPGVGPYRTVELEVTGMT